MRKAKKAKKKLKKIKAKSDGLLGNVGLDTDVLGGKLDDLTGGKLGEITDKTLDITHTVEDMGGNIEDLASGGFDVSKLNNVSELVGSSSKLGASVLRATGNSKIASDIEHINNMKVGKISSFLKLSENGE
jgi:hypothetical protein